MGSAIPHRERGRTLIARDPDQLIWALAARESKVDSRRDPLDGAKVDHQLNDLRRFVRDIGGRIEREVPEPNVSSFARHRVELPDGTYGYRVIRPEWESLLTALRRGECNALAVVDIDRATRDPRILEDLIDTVEMYGVYVVSMTGNIDLSTDAGIAAARNMVNQRNAESRNSSRRVIDGKRRAAQLGKNSGGPNRSFGWRKDRIHINKRESAHIKREIPRIVAGATPLTIAQEWNQRKIPTVTGVAWRAATVRNMFTRPRMCGMVVYRGEIMNDDDGNPVRGRWEPIMTDDEYHAVVRAWTPKVHTGSDTNIRSGSAGSDTGNSRLGARGRGYRTNHLLSPFVRCGKCNARMIGTWRKDPRTGQRTEMYRCPQKGQGGCSGIARVAAPIDAYVTALVIADHQRINAHKVEELPPWPREKELADLNKRIDESTRQYEIGNYPAESYFPSLSRMEAARAELRREQARYATRQDARRTTFANLAEEWKKPSFTMELKQAAIAKSLSAVVIAPAGKGIRFHPDQLTPIFQQEP